MYYSSHSARCFDHNTVEWTAIMLLFTNVSIQGIERWYVLRNNTLDTLLFTLFLIKAPKLMNRWLHESSKKNGTQHWLFSQLVIFSGQGHFQSLSLGQGHRGTRNNPRNTSPPMGTMYTQSFKHSFISFYLLKPVTVNLSIVTMKAATVVV